MKSKRCTQCRRVKRLDLFHRVKAGEEKRASQCKRCDNARKTAYQRAKSLRLGKKQKTCTLVARELRKQGLKHCPRCKADKSFDSFYSNKASADRLSSHCILCMREIAKSFPKAKQTVEEKRRHRDTRLTRKYGIPLAEYERLYEAQRGRCAICSGKDTNKTLAVDHSHKTGKVRGLLCGRCNPAIGFLQDDPQIAASAVAYLKKHQE